MCVILLAETARPSEEMVEKAFDTNKHGAGIAWRSNKLDEDGNEILVNGHPIPEVIWEKGLNLQEIQEYVRTVPLPFVAHFRIASCGGQRAELTHPFPISRTVSTLLSGRTDGEVLFHNGHWGKWKEIALETAVRTGVSIPDGALSDTRMMAWCAHLYGKNFVDLIDEKGVAFGPKDLTMFWGTGWNKEEGVWVSNTFFKWGGKKVSTTDPTGAYSGQKHVYRRCSTPGCMAMTTNDSGVCIQCSVKKEKEVPQGTSPTTVESIDSLPTTEIQMDTSGIETSPGGDVSIPFAQWEAAQVAHRRGEIGKRKYKRAKKEWMKALATTASPTPSSPSVH